MTWIDTQPKAKIAWRSMKPVVLPFAKDRMDACLAPRKAGPNGAAGLLCQLSEGRPCEESITFGKGFDGL